MCKELQQQPDLMMELVQQKGKSLQVSVEDFIQNFKWDDTQYKQHQSLQNLGTKIMGQQKSADDRLKKIIDELSQCNTKVAQLTKK